MSILTFLLVVFITAVVGTLLGYVIHWCLHRKQLGFLMKMHMAHHLTHYPPQDYLSDKYRNAGTSSSSLIFLPVILLFVGFTFAILYYFKVNPWIYAIIVVESLIIGFIHDYAHELFHIKNNFLEKYDWFQRLRAKHYIHHVEMEKNFGIVSFFWDKVFKTHRNNMK